MDERVAWFWIGQVFIGQHFRIERFVVAEILFLEALRIDFIFLGEFVALRRIEGVEGADCLRGERLAIHQKQDAPELFAFQQAVNLGNCQQRLSRARGHGDEQLALAREQRAFRGDNRRRLVRAQADDFFRRSVEQPLAGIAGLESEAFRQGRGGVKTG